MKARQPRGGCEAANGSCSTVLLFTLCPPPNRNPNVTWFGLPPKSIRFLRGPCTTFPPNFVKIGPIVFAQSYWHTNAAVLNGGNYCPRIAFLESVNFSTCAYVQIFNFRDGHVTTFRHPSGAYICQMPSDRLSRLAKCTPSESRLSIGTIGLGKTVSSRLCAGQSKGTLKMRKNAVFWIWICPRYKIPEFFTIAGSVLASTLTVCRRNRGDPSSIYST